MKRVTWVSRGGEMCGRFTTTVCENIGIEGEEATNSLSL